MIRYDFVFTNHAKKRCIQRNIDKSLLRRQLHVIQYDEDKNKLKRWDIPGTNLFVVFMDINCKRVIVTVSFRYCSKRLLKNDKNKMEKNNFYIIKLSPYPNSLLD